MENLDRRGFLQRVGRGALGAAALGAMPAVLGGCGEDRPTRAGDRHRELAPLADRLAVARHEDARAATLAALAALGGAEAVVRRGDRVVVKPNMAWVRAPRFAANTSPTVVGTLTERFLAAGAEEVVVLDRTCPPGRHRDAYRVSGIAPAVEAAGGTVREVPERDSRYTRVVFEGVDVLPENRHLPDHAWPIFTDVLEADLLVNVPVAKQHQVAGVTLGLKNLMGVMGGDRGDVHPFIHEAVAQLATGVRPHLTVLDATRMLVANGPTGGRVEDVVEARTVVAGVDPVAVDAWAVAHLPWRRKPDRETLTFLDWAGKLGVGDPDPARKRILSV
jgi:uncharacterized protein (DUF362 family)